MRQVWVHFRCPHDLFPFREDHPPPRTPPLAPPLKKTSIPKATGVERLLSITVAHTKVPDAPTHRAGQRWPSTARIVARLPPPHRAPRPHETASPRASYRCRTRQAKRTMKKKKKRRRRGGGGHATPLRRGDQARAQRGRPGVHSHSPRGTQKHRAKRERRPRSPWSAADRPPPLPAPPPRLFRMAWAKSRTTSTPPRDVPMPNGRPPHPLDENQFPWWTMTPALLPREAEGRRATHHWATPEANACRAREVGRRRKTKVGRPTAVVAVSTPQTRPRLSSPSANISGVAERKDVERGDRAHPLPSGI